MAAQSCFNCHAEERDAFGQGCGGKLIVLGREEKGPVLTGDHDLLALLDSVEQGAKCLLASDALSFMVILVQSA